MQAMIERALSEEQRMMRNTIRAFVDKEVIPFIRKNWEKEWDMKPENRPSLELLEGAQKIGVRLDVGSRRRRVRDLCEERHAADLLEQILFLEMVAERDQVDRLQRRGELGVRLEEHAVARELERVGRDLVHDSIQGLGVEQDRA